MPVGGQAYEKGMKSMNQLKKSNSDRPRTTKPVILVTGKAYSPHIGGIETVMQQVAEGFRKKAHISVLTCRDDMGLTQKEKLNGVRVTRCGSLGTVASCPISFSYLSEFRRKVMVSDVVELHLPFPLADLALILSGYRGRVVVAWHSDVVRQKKLLRFYKPLMQKLLKRADAILVATKGHIDSSPYLQPYREKCVIVPYGLSVAEYDAVPKMPVLTAKLRDPAAKKILFVGRLVYYKGVDVLLEAFAKVQTTSELFLAGTGVLEESLMARAEALGISARVHFLGKRMTPELRAAFADCDIFVLPSVANSEAFGIVQLEAMVYGKPVINTALPTGVPLVSLDGETGITVPPSDADALAAAMETLLSDDTLRLAYGAAARKRVEETFAIERVLSDTWNVLVSDLWNRYPKKR